jgi:positive regulator of sigma E activity
MKEIGMVSKVLNELNAEVEIKESPACVKCGMCMFKSTGNIKLEVTNPVGAKAGDQVEIDLPEAKVILSSMLIFILPLIVFFVGYLIKGPVLAAVMLAGYLVWLYYYDKKSKAIPRITRVLYNQG